MPYYSAKTHKSVCICCGKEFDLSNRNKLSLCADCKDHGAICPICGKSMPYGKKFCSYSCNSKHNISIKNPMDNPESRKKIGETLRANFGEIWEENARKRTAERQEWLSHADERKAAGVAKWKETRAKNCKPVGMAHPEAKKRIMATAAKNGGMGLANPSAKAKARKTSLERYGYENPVLSPQVRETISQKVKIFRNDPEIKAKAINTLQERYGVSNAYHVGMESREPIFKSVREQEIADFIESLGVKLIRHNHSVLGDRELDIYCPEHNLAIEYNGVYWHSGECGITKKYHYDKTTRCAEKGIRLIHVWEWEWLDDIKREIIKSVIAIALGKVHDRIYARNCEVRPVSTSDYRAFCNLHHLQGYRHASLIYGLYYQGNLVQLMSFNAPQKRNARENFQWEIVRGCPGSNNIVVGGVEKLWKHFLREQNPISVMSYCDMNKFDGKSYLAIGMQLYKIEPANVYYVEHNTGKVMQWLYRNKERREEQLRTHFTVYGAGNMTFVWRKPNAN